MRKITFYFMMLLSITAFSQVEIVENFDSLSNNGVPTGWTSNNLDASASYACGGSGMSVYGGMTAAGQSISLTTANYTAVTNATNLTASFSFNVFEQVSQFPPPTFSAPAANWGTLVLEYSVDGGANWTNITTINDSNYTYVSNTECVATATIDAGALVAGTDFQARFVATAQNINNFALLVFVDNVEIKQTATTVPNCDAVLTNPLNGATDAEPDVLVTWQPATGIPTGYTISVGTASGGTDIVNAVTTTETSYQLNGLDYETEYFVNIVPFNGFGPATGCTEESFTTRTAPLPGATCSEPIVISSFPYVEAGGNTDNYEDNIDVSPCSNSYMNGKDVFYQITPVTDISINIDVTGIDNNGASVHVVDGCPDVATTCVAYVGSFSGDTRSLQDVVLYAGNTYFVVLSNSGSTRTYNYNLIIAQNSCVNPEMTLTPVSDCGNGQYNVDVDVTYLGSATTLTLSDGVNNQSISATGVVTMGPYPSGSTTNFSLTNDQDGSCVYNDSTFLYCPPSNDECSAPIALPVNTDDTCTLFTSATNAGATHSAESGSACSTTDSNDVWFTFVAESANMVIEYLNVTAAINSGGTNQATEIFEGSCGSLTSIVCKTGNYAFISGLTIGNTYYLRNYTALGTGYAQNYDLCVRTAPTPPANDDCSGAIALTVSTGNTCDNAVNGTTVGATRSSDSTCPDTSFTSYSDVWYVLNPTVTGIYEFSMTTNSGPSAAYFVYSGACGALVEESTSCSTTSSLILSLDSTETYYVMVKTAMTEPGSDFDLCVWQLPDAVSNDDCDGAMVITESPDSTGANMISGNMDNSYHSVQSCASASYEDVWYSFTPNYTGTYHFDFTRVTGSAYYTVFDTGDCSSVNENYISGFSSCFNSTDKPGDVVAGNTYLIMVHASTAAEYELFVYPDPSLSTASVDFESFKYYPNPTSNTLTVEAGNTISHISVYNIVGQEVKSVEPNNLKTVLDMSSLTNGVYFVSVDINTSRKTFKVIKR